MSTFSMDMPFYIDTDGYTDRDREMFVAGAEFMQQYTELRVLRGEHKATIMAENTSRVRLMCGRFGFECEIADTEYPEWKFLTVRTP